MEEEIIWQLEMFQKFGIDINVKTYPQCISELIDRHDILLRDKARRDKNDFRENLINIQRYPN